jgi:hypothetical protein
LKRRAIFIRPALRDCTNLSQPFTSAAITYAAIKAQEKKRLQKKLHCSASKLWQALAVNRGFQGNARVETYDPILGRAETPFARAGIGWRGRHYIVAALQLQTGSANAEFVTAFLAPLTGGTGCSSRRRTHTTAP